MIKFTTFCWILVIVGLCSTAYDLHGLWLSVAAAALLLEQKFPRWLERRK